MNTQAIISAVVAEIQKVCQPRELTVPRLMTKEDLTKEIVAAQCAPGISRMRDAAKTLVLYEGSGGDPAKYRELESRIKCLDEPATTVELCERIIQMIRSGSGAPTDKDGRMERRVVPPPITGYAWRWLPPHYKAAAARNNCEFNTMVAARAAHRASHAVQGSEPVIRRAGWDLFESEGSDYNYGYVLAETPAEHRAIMASKLSEPDPCAERVFNHRGDRVAPVQIAE